jgi:AbrB family looped-hinge helix DNA binding protein
MTSKVTSKGQVTLPKKIREKLGIHTGDSLVYEIDGNTVRVRKAEPFDTVWHRAISQTVADEWDSQYDHESFDDL